MRLVRMGEEEDKYACENAVKVCFEKFGITANAVVAAAKKVLGR